uniref:Uncharacterized protein n=1 Tax=Avena sativa TaxID=4498 RepID=A0ACD5X9T2_AVESA
MSSQMESEARSKRKKSRPVRKASSVSTSSRETGSKDHVGGAGQPQSAQIMEELAVSFSEQLLDDTETGKLVHDDEVGEGANNNTILSPEQVGLAETYKEMLADEEDGMVKYKCFWEDTWGSSSGSFEDCTYVAPLLYAHGPTPAHATICSCLQIFSIKVMENEVWRIKWPVEVYGFIAARDTVDQNRNLLFSRTRDNPQILTPMDPFLQLTGPCRPILLIDPVDFEIQLKVKGTKESEDKIFMAKRFVYGHGFGQSGHLACRCWEGNFCTLEITSALLGSTVAATIISADVIEGSWPDDCGGRVVSQTAGIDKDFVLLDSGDGPMHVDTDGHITLQRGVVCVWRAGILTVSVEAYSKDGISTVAHVEFRPKDCWTSIGTCNLGFCTVMFIVGWSLAALKYEMEYNVNEALARSSPMASTRNDDVCRLNPHPDLVSEQQREARRKRRQRRRARRKDGFIPPSSGESGSGEHVGDAAKTEADSFSEQLPGRIDDNGKSPLGILVEEKDLVSYRHEWESSWGGKFGLFDNYTCVSSMLFTWRPTPPHAGVKTCLQIFSIRVTKIDDRLEWPLEIYGLVATRDSMDHNRNIIFRRGRDACQFLTDQGSLMLTGPTHGVVFTDPVDIEIQLKVKGITEAEDKDLISKVLVCEHDFGSENSGGAGQLVRSTCSSKLCSLELTSALIAGAVEATIISAEVIQGQWPKNLGMRVVSGTTGIDEEFILLDARDGRFRTDGVIPLSRTVVCVEQDGGLKLSVEAYKRKGGVYERSAVTVLKPKRFSASIGVCKLPFCTVRFTVCWSCLANVDDMKSHGI